MSTKSPVAPQLDGRLEAEDEVETVEPPGLPVDVAKLSVDGLTSTREYEMVSIVIALVVMVEKVDRVEFAYGGLGETWKTGDVVVAVQDRVSLLNTAVVGPPGDTVKAGAVKVEYISNPDSVAVLPLASVVEVQNISTLVS